MRAFCAIALTMIGCQGDILPIALPGPAFTTEVGNIVGPMQEVRGGFEGPIAVGGGSDPVLLERREGAWVPLRAPDDWRRGITDAAVVQGVLFIAGDDGQIAAGDRERLDPITSSATFPLHAVFARSSADVFFAGEGGVLHYDGAAVTQIETASIASSESFFAVWGTGSTVVVAGAGGAALMISGSSVALTDTGTIATLRSLHGVSPTEIYAAGGDDRGAVLRWNGQVWSDMALPFMPPLHAVFAGRSGIWVCGDAGYLARWDGQRWIEIASTSIVALTGAYEQEGDLYLTGGNVLDPAATGFVVRYGE